MGILVALAAGLVFWISAWALGAKAFDAFLVTVALVVMAATARIAAPFVRRLTRQQEPETGPPL
jgi:hypothetical protein